MALPREAWTESMGRAVPWVESAMKRELSATAALRELRAGGGAIRTQDWYSLWNTIAETEDKSEIIPRLPPSSTIPESWHQERPWQYQREYNTIVSVQMFDEYNLPIGETYITVGADERLTWGEIREEADSVIRQAGYELAMASYNITSVTAVRRI